MSNFPNQAANALSVNGAITPLAAANYYAITKVTSPAAIFAGTLALPTVDGQKLTVFDTVGGDHTITVPIASPPVAGLNGSKATATFNGSVGSFIELLSYAGSWYVVGSSGVTVA